MVQLPAGARDISPLQSMQRSSGVHPASFAVVHVLLFLGIKWLDEDCHSSPSKAEVMNEQSYTSTPSYASMVCRGAALPYVLPLEYTSFYFCCFLRMLG
jgi:hypothetical protein